MFSVPCGLKEQFPKHLGVFLQPACNSSIIRLQSETDFAPAWSLDDSDTIK